MDPSPCTRPSACCGRCNGRGTGPAPTCPTTRALPRDTNSDARGAWSADARGGAHRGVNVHWAGPGRDRPPRLEMLGCRSEGRPAGAIEAEHPTVLRRAVLGDRIRWDVSPPAAYSC